MQKNEAAHSLTPHTGINSTWINDFTVRLKSIKLLEGNTGIKAQMLLMSLFFLVCLLG